MQNLISEILSLCKQQSTDFNQIKSLLFELKNKASRRMYKTINLMINLTDNFSKLDNGNYSEYLSKMEDQIYDLKVQLLGNYQVDKKVETVEDVKQETIQTLIEDIEDPDFEYTVLSRIPGFRIKADKSLHLSEVQKSEIKVWSDEDESIKEDIIKKNVLLFKDYIPDLTRKSDIDFYNLPIYSTTFIGDILNHFSVKFDNVYPGQIVRNQLIVSVPKDKIKISKDELYKCSKSSQTFEKDIIKKVKDTFNFKPTIFWFKSKKYPESRFGWCVPISWALFRYFTPNYLSFLFDCCAVKKQLSIEELKVKRLEKEKQLEPLIKRLYNCNKRIKDIEKEQFILDEELNLINTELDSLVDNTLIVSEKLKIISNKKQLRENQANLLLKQADLSKEYKDLKKEIKQLKEKIYE